MTRILVFAKAPVPGQVKTRLIPRLGAQGAAALAARMLEQTLEAAAATGLTVELCGDPDPRDWYQGPGVALSAQGPGELGGRLRRAAKRVLAAGEPVLLIGTDCPSLDEARLSAAAAQLRGRDAVIHPTVDGGYALLGLRRFHPSLFEGIAWSTASVAAETLARIGELGWSVSVLETLHDIDEPADLARQHVR
ncbi:MAG TPA: TIGR04282 family arsenosugar biosynthesis glycosyltransferase [Allosphingosinicella sp.]|nr:TIGR04282 family arsenosugar biosynthesis glycosyltransferase [Allosphingosinicella sp.]